MFVVALPTGVPEGPMDRPACWVVVDSSRPTSILGLAVSMEAVERGVIMVQMATWVADLVAETIVVAMVLEEGTSIVEGSTIIQVDRA